MVTKRRKASIHQPEMQRRQIVIEEPLDGGSPIMTLRWDMESMPLGEMEGWTLEQAKRYAAHCQLGREEGEITWTFNEFGAYRVWYSGVWLTLNGGTRPTDQQVAEYRTK